jgi:hypothetical protein
MFSTVPRKCLAPADKVTCGVFTSEIAHNGQISAYFSLAITQGMTFDRIEAPRKG